MSKTIWARVAKLLLYSSLFVELGCGTIDGADPSLGSQRETTAASVSSIGPTSGPFTLPAGSSLRHQGLELIYQLDGNLVLYREDAPDLRRPLWSTKTSGRSCVVGCVARFQGDGNLVLYQHQTPYWASSTAGNRGAQLRLAARPPYLAIEARERTIWSAAEGLVWLTALDPFSDYGEDRPGAPDFMKLFQSADNWPNGAGHVNVIKLYAQTIHHAPDEQLRVIFSFLRRNNIALALEFGAVTPGTSCGVGIEGGAGATAARALGNKIKRLGGDLSYVAMDEPLYYFHYDTTRGTPPHVSCKFPISVLAKNVAQSYAAFRESFPRVIFGDIEPVGVLPSASWAEELAAFTRAFEGATGGSPLAFLHDDANMEAPAWQARVRRLQSVLAANHVAYGAIRNGVATAPSDVAWISSAIARIQLYRAMALPAPTHEVIQSWNPQPARVLPETDPSTLTFLSSYLFPPPAAAAATRPIFRLRHPETGRYLYSASASEGAALGYRSEGIAFRVFPAAHASAAPLYRCVTGDGRGTFLSRNGGCGGQRSDGLLGYLDQAISTRAPAPLFRCSLPSGPLYTVVGAECLRAGGSVDGMLGFAVAP